MTMSEKNKIKGFTPKDHLISIRPAVLAGILTLIATTVTALIRIPSNEYLNKIIMIIYGVAGNIYLTFFYIFFISISSKKLLFGWINAVIAGVSIGILALILPDEMDLMISTLIIVAAILSAVISERPQSYFIIVSGHTIMMWIHQGWVSILHGWTEHLVMVILAILASETIHQLKKLAEQQINRLEIINEFSKEIVSTLETKQILTLLNVAFQNAIKADSYYIGIVNGDEINFEIFYDEGEYFHNVHIKRKSTLSNWVITHQEELFLPDLRQNIELEDVDTVIAGKEKTSLSWMGAPIRGLHVDGVMAIASYRENAFDRSDMELLSNIAQRAALALDNTYQHAMVEKEARLDSLTRVYNHGYFIQALRKQAQTCLSENQPLSLIMLDIDFFKQYNDAYGHLVGDEILVSLCKVIQSHVKATDAVGRWGGEEFAISLPNSTGQQAILVAERIRSTMSALKVRNNEQMTIPIPTVSQGIAVFPMETNDTTKLIDLADNRLYIAKERGRDQVEPTAAFWENKQSN
jgi:diguanylate cyclase (GGDEF)-like protein